MKMLGNIIVLVLLGWMSASAQIDTAWVRTYGNGTAGYFVDTDTLGNVFVGGPHSTPSGAALISYSPSGQILWSLNCAGINDPNPPGPAGMKVTWRGDIFLLGPAYSDNPNLHYYYTARYATQGDSLWARFYAGPVYNAAFPSALAADDFGNVYVTGTSDGPSWATLKYDRDGNQVWTRLYTGYPVYFTRQVCRIVLDNAGNVIVFGLTAGRVNETFSGITVVKYDSAGNELWAARQDSSSIMYLAYLAVDAAGNIFVSALDDHYAHFRMPLIVKILPTGDIAWSRTFDGVSNFEGMGYPIAVDSAGNVYQSGASFAPGNYNYDIVTIKYSPAGETCWVRVYADPDSNADIPSDVVVGQSGSIYIVANSRDNAGGDFLLIKYNPDGEQVWLSRYENPENMYGNYIYDMTLDREENILVTGSVAYSLTTIKFLQAPTAVEDSPVQNPDDISVLAAYPNPFNSQTTLNYLLPRPGLAALSIFNLLGQKVAILFDGMQSVGEHSIIWNASTFPSGIYFARLQAGERSQTAKMVLLK